MAWFNGGATIKSMLGWVNNVTRIFRFSVCYICLVLWMQTMKHTSALVYMAITFIILFGVQKLERSYSVQRSLEWGQLCNLHATRSRCSRTLTSTDFYNWHKRQLEYHMMHFYHTTNITQYCERIELQK